MTFKQSEEKNYEQSGNVTLVFKQNRHKELHVAGKVYHFWGAERLEVPKEVILHKDFESQKHYFVIKEK